MRKWTGVILFFVLLLGLFHLFSKSPEESASVADETEKTNLVKTTESAPVPAEQISEAPIVLPQLPMSAMDMARAIRENRLCNEANEPMIRFDVYNSVQFHVQLYTALVMANGGDVKDESCALALMTRNREQALAYSRKESQADCLFVRALILTDQLNFLENKTPQKSEMKEGRDILTQLQQSFPDNGIYTFFKIGTFGDDVELAEQEADNFTKYEKFEIPLQPLHEKIYRRGRLNGTAWLKTIEVTSALNIPNYTVGLGVFKSLFKKEFASPELETWIENFHAKMEKIDSLQLMEPHISLLEIASFRTIGSTYFKARTPAQNPPGLYNQETFVPFFQRRIQDVLDGSLTIDGDEKCDEMLRKVNDAHPTYLTKQQESFERLKELRQ